MKNKENNDKLAHNTEINSKLDYVVENLYKKIKCYVVIVDNNVVQYFVLLLLSKYFFSNNLYIV